MRLPKPTLVGMRAGMLLFLYRRRLRAHPVQELLAAAGIAVGVALVLGVLVANSSLTSSAGELVHGLAGSARLQLSARSPAGLPEGLVDRVRSLPAVQLATPVLRQSVLLAGPRGGTRVQLIGVAPSLVSLGGIAAQQSRKDTLLLSSGLGLPAKLAGAIGAGVNAPVRVMSGGHARTVKVQVLLGGGALSMLADSPVAIASLATAQRLTARVGRVTEVLVEPRPGADAAARAQLRALAAGRIDVTGAENELRLLSQATQPNRQSTSLFSAISVMVGFLLALNAMLLTVPERRRFIAELRMQGYAPAQVLLLLGFEAVALGLVASLVGVALGWLLSGSLFQELPAYLSAAFPLGTHRAFRAGTFALAIACGVLATVLASLSPALDLRRGRAPDAVFREPAGGGEVVAARTIAVCATLGVVLIGLVGLIATLAPGLTILGGVALAAATLCLMPPALAALAALLPWATCHTRSGAIVVAVAELRAITARSVALASIAALAVYGCVAIGGTRSDLLRGIDSATVQYHHTADVWVTAAGDLFNTDSFVPGSTPAAIAALPEVRSVRIYRGGLTDIGKRRLWVRARPSQDALMVEPSQILQGPPDRVQRLLRAGGWVAVSNTFAHEHHLSVGARLALPTPAGVRRVGVAAITTNSGWPSGTITLAGSDYARWWGAREATALEVGLRAGMDPTVGARAVGALLGSSRPGLSAQSSGESIVQAKASARQGLRTLGQISTLLLIAAALAVASALSAAVWQRRARFASLRIQGYDPAQLWWGLLLESAAMLGVGSVMGALVGVYGHALASRWLTLTTGFPAPFAVGATQVFLTLAFITAIALAVIALPGLAAARVSPRLSLQE